ncbi:MAG: hypothetical protein CMJ18_22695 [Phycisphaeraceae bacterium]|nr:hypothetical protein [Phycisphaeraceae bacterium]
MVQLLKEVLFSPRNITEHHKCYDYVEPMLKDETPVLTVETDWEREKGIQFFSVIRSKRDGRYRMWYQSGFKHRSEAGEVIIDNSVHGVWRKVVCYAQSDDGVNWVRPKLNLYLSKQFPGNNIVMDWAGVLLECPSVIEDVDDPNPARRYKMLVYHLDPDDPAGTGGCLFFSPDGLHFTFTGHTFPSQDAECLWYDRIHKRYVAFLKERCGEQRIRMMSVSTDCESWTEPHVLFAPDTGDDKGTNFYQQSAFIMNGRCLGFVNIFDVTSQSSWLELAESPDGLSWYRLPGKSPVLKPGDIGSIDGGGVYCGLSEPIVDGDRTWVYYFAAPHRHDGRVSEGAEKLKQCAARASFPTNRLVGQQTEREGYFATVPVACPGGTLHLNYRCANEVRVELMDPGYGRPIKGFTRDDCVPMTGDEKDAPVRWKHGRNLDELQGRFFKIRLEGDNMKAYSAGFRS